MIEGGEEMGCEGSRGWGDKGVAGSVMDGT